MMKIDAFTKKGSVTIFISLILCTLMIFIEVVAEYYKSYAASSIIENSIRLTAYTATADFDRTLMDAYGLFKMSNDIDELNKNLEEYFENSLNASNIEFEEDDLSDFLITPRDIDDSAVNNILNMNLESFAVKGINGSELYNCDVLEKQIVEYSKYRAPVMLSQELLEKFKVFNSIEETENVVKSKTEYDAALSEVQIKFMEIYESEEKITNYKKKLSFENFKDLLDNIRNGDSVNDSLSEIDSYNLFIFENQLFEENSKEHLNSIGSEYFTDDIYKFMKTLHASSLRDYALILKSNEEFIVNAHENYRMTVNDRDKIEEELKNLCAEKNGHSNDYSTEEGDESKKNDNDNIEELNEKIKEKNENLKYLNDIISKFSSIENTYDDLHSIPIEVKNDYMRNMLEINSFLLDEYNIVNAISCEFENINDLLLSIRDEVLEKIDSKLEKYEESVKKLDDGSIKHAFETDVGEKCDCIDIEEINNLIKIVDENIEYFDQYKMNMEKMSYRGQNICIEKLIYSNQINRINEEEYRYDVEMKNLMNYSNIYKDFFVSQNFYENICDIKSSDFYEYIKKHIKISESIDEKVNTDIENINVLVDETYENMEDEGGVDRFIPDEGVIYDDLASKIYYDNEVINDDELCGEAVMDEKIEDMTTSQSDIENSKERSLEQIKYFDSNIMNTFNGFDFKESENGCFENMRNELYILSYINEKFNNQVNELEGLHYTDCEMEYLIYGTKGNRSFSNKEKANSSIFATRYLLNTVYAYTDSEIRSYTLSLATSIAGFTGFGIAVVQNVFILMLSFAETILDMKNLLNGDDVVVYKSVTTWKLKPSNLTREAVVEVSKDLISKGLEDMKKDINTYFDEKSEETLETMLSSVDNVCEMAINEVIDSVVSSLMAPIESKLLAFGKVTENINLRDEYINILEHLETGNEVYDEILEYASSSILNDRIDEIDSKISEIGGINEESVSRYIRNLVDDEKEKLIIKLKNEYSDKIKNEIRSGLLECENKGIDFVNEKVEEYFDKLNFSYVQCESSNNGNYSFERSSFITMNYGEYLNLFLIAKLLTSGKDDILLRLADIIKVNFTMCDESENKGFKLKGSYTLIEVSAKVNSNFKDFVKENYFLKDNIDWKLVYGY